MSVQAMYDTVPMAVTPVSRETLRVLGRVLDDIEHARIQSGNRIAALTREGIGGTPLDEIVFPGLVGVEDLARKELERITKQDPLWPWASEIRGVGALSFGRLLGELGDPSIGSTGHWETRGHGGDDAHPSHAPLERVWVVDAYYDRSVSQLWQYCGVGDPARSKIPRGAVQAEILARGKPRLKKQLYLIATAMLKAGNREVYDAARAHYAERVHDKPCPQCRATPGDPWKPGHQHAAALRKCQKEFLKGLWREARRLRGLA